MWPSPTYPYQRDQQYIKFIGAENIPRQVCTYLMDMPLPNYNPPTENIYPWVRLMKFLFYDGISPLDEPCPTTEQKLSVLFDPEHPTAPVSPEKGYRIFPQAYVAQAQNIGDTSLRCYMGQTVAKGSYRAELSVIFELTTNVNYESASGYAISRTYAMECALIEALNGVNMNGVGTFYFDRTQHPSCGSWNIDDRGTNLGRRVILGLTWQD